MERCLRRVRRPWRAFACAALAVGLSACGGGGGGQPPDQGGSGGGNQPESAYLLAEFVAQDTNHQFIRVWDPAHPDVTIQQVPIVAVDGVVWTASHLMFSDATSVDPAARAVTTLGHAKAFFASGGMVWAIDLRGGQSHVPVQVSAVVDANAVLRVWTLDAAGADAWLEVDGGLHGWAMRATMAPTDPGVSIDSIPAALRDASGLPQYFLVALGGRNGTHMDEVTFGVRTLDFAPVAVPALATMNVNDGWLGADPAQAGLGYIRLDNAVQALRWSAAGASVDPAPLYPLANPIYALAATVGADAVYVGDGTAVIAVANGVATPVGELGNAAGVLVDAGDYVAAAEFDVLQPPTQCCNVIESLRKADSSVALLAAAEQLHLLGASAHDIVFAEDPAVPGAAPGFTLMAGDGSGRVDVPGTWIALVRAATAGLDQAAPATALLTCPTVPGQPGFCGPGALTQVDLASGASTGLGTLAPASLWMQAPNDDAVAGLPFALGGETKVDSPLGFGRHDTDHRDAWQFTPGAAGSLVRVTTNVP
jgi:hypothetical protein